MLEAGIDEPTSLDDIAEKETDSDRIIKTLSNFREEMIAFLKLKPEFHGEKEDATLPGKAISELITLEWTHNHGDIEGREMSGSSLWLGNMSSDKGLNLTNIGINSPLGLKTISYYLSSTAPAPTGTIKIETNEGVSLWILGRDTADLPADAPDEAE